LKDRQVSKRKVLLEENEEEEEAEAEEDCRRRSVADASREFFGELETQIKSSCS